MSKKFKYGYFVAGVAVLSVAAIFIGKKIKRSRQIALEVEEGNTEVQDSVDIFYDTPVQAYAPFCGTDHFSQSEFDSKDGVEVPDEYKGNVQQVMNQLEVLRAELGNKPITVNCGYRSPEHNKAVGGVPNSQHLVGKAADIHSDYYTPAEIKAMIEKLISDGSMTQGGIGLYKNFVHYDIRGTNARWNG